MRVRADHVGRERSSGMRKSFSGRSGNHPRLAAGEDDAAPVGLVARVGHDGHVPGITNANGRWASPSLEPMSGSSSALGSTATPKRRSIHAATASRKLPEPDLEGVARHGAGLSDRRLQRLHHGGRRRQVGVAGPQVDDVHALASSSRRRSLKPASG